MTAILKDIRDLDAQHARGEITTAQHARARDTLLQSIEIAETDFIPSPAASAPATAQDAKDREISSAFAFSIVICLTVMGGSMALILLLLPDLNLALTLGVTVLAALTVALFRALDD